MSEFVRISASEAAIGFGKERKMVIIVLFSSFSTKRTNADWVCFLTEVLLAIEVEQLDKTSPGQMSRTRFPL